MSLYSMWCVCNSSTETSSRCYHSNDGIISPFRFRRMSVSEGMSFRWFHTAPSDNFSSILFVAFVIVVVVFGKMWLCWKMNVQSNSFFPPKLTFFAFKKFVASASYFLRANVCNAGCRLMEIPRFNWHLMTSLFTRMKGKVLLGVSCCCCCVLSVVRDSLVSV